MRLAYQLAKKVISEGPGRERLRSVFGSADYKTAGPMRSILTKVVTEDLTACASTVRCPTLLIYGDQDQDTPPEMGKRFQALIAHSELVILEGFGHTDIILKGRYQVSNLINRFLRNLR
jgi:pimeloyl-ACP methyl ester carboxylesterase